MAGQNNLEARMNAPPDLDPGDILERVATAQLRAIAEAFINRAPTPYAVPPSDHLGLRTLEVFADYCASIGEAPEKDPLLLTVCEVLHIHTGRILAAAGETGPSAPVLAEPVNAGAPEA